MKAATSSMGKEIIKERWSAFSLVSVDHQPVERVSLALELGLGICWAMVGEKDKHFSFCRSMQNVHDIYPPRNPSTIERRVILRGFALGLHPFSSHLIFEQQS